MRENKPSRCCPTAGRALGFRLAASAAVLLAGCDLGGRDRPFDDAGTDGDTDADTDTGDDGGPPDAGPDAGPDWRYGDAGQTWDDGTIEITGPCANDCEYSYNMDPFGDWHRYGSGTFSFSEGDPGEVVARETSWVSWFLYYSWSNLQRYRQRILADYVLDETTHALESAEVSVYRQLCGVAETLRYSFSYDDAADEFSYGMEFNGREWGRTIPAPEAPLIMFNYRNYPLASKGHSSSLFFYLLGERYDWTAGGTQQLPVFSPEVERMDTVTVEEGTAEGSLVVRFPEEENMAPDGPGTWSYNAVTVTYEHDIPVSITGRNYLQWDVVSAPSTELNMADLGATTPVGPPAPLGGYTTGELTVTSGAVTLAGSVQDPVGAGPHPAVIMLPGWDYMTRRGEVGAFDLYEQLADRLAAAGYLTVRVDCRGRGASSGDLSTATVDELIADGVAVLAEVADMPEVDAGGIFVLTMGSGVHVAAGIAEDAGIDPAGLILLSPVGHSRADVAGTLAQHYYDNAYAFENYVNEVVFDAQELFEDILDDTYAGDPYLGHDNDAWQSLAARDLVSEPVALPPVLIVHGAEDHLIPATIPEALAAALDTTTTDVTSAILPGLSHALTGGTAAGLWPEHSSVEEVGAAAVGAMTTWLSAQTGGK